MIYQFDTEDEHAATAALLLYCIWRSRDRKRFRIDPDLWSRIERFTKAAAKRAETLPRFIEALKPRLMCATINPRAMAVGVTGEIALIAAGDGAYIQPHAPEGQREFLTSVLERADHRQVLDRLYRETAWVVLLVRDRLEREKPIEARFETTLDTLADSEQEDA